MRACWLKWVGRDWSISADYIWLNYSGANNATRAIRNSLMELLGTEPPKTEEGRYSEEKRNRDAFKNIQGT